ncbi:Emc6p [Lachancea thermotolerans CBS 6340]|uniref:ER membrane protein complex subunit 6 n=1 Tax=Lachancea thermotolerans (strain ATCC 56472 / CBS 6340 / NRRL Y-8284) TaxID=559295 RepID=C5DCJ4_LACTC|nr:KLTH0B03542p [Lachancea thermotolerans CBS 6340]CAR21505.1 KLTH0B03542p [Lachancea thermotolerans CBS 6340]
MSSQELFRNIKAQESIAYNKKVLLYIQDATSLGIGCGAGILQLEGSRGFAAFVSGYAVVALLFIAWFCGLSPKRFFQSPIQEIFFDSFFRELMGFVMAWTFVYALVD